MKQLRSTLFLLLAAAIFGGYIYFNERGPLVQEGATVLFKMDPAKVAEIRLDIPSGPAVSLQRSGTSWSVAESTKAKGGTAVPADDSTVQTLLDGLQLVQTGAVVEGGPAKLKDYGLDKPVAKVTADGQTISFGSSPSFDKSRIYALAGDKVGLVPATLADTAKKPFQDWRDKLVLRFKPDEATEMSITAPLGTLSLAKQGDKWTMVKPNAVAADASTVTGFLSTLSTTQTAAWLDDKPASLAKYGLEHPQGVVQVGTVTLKVGNKSSDGFAAQNSLSPAVFKLPASVWTQINRPVREWRNKQVATFSLDDVTSADVSYDGKTKSLQKVDNKWQLAGQKADEKVNQAGLDLLTGAMGWTAGDFVDQPYKPATYGLDKPLLTLALNGKTPQTLKIGQANGKVYADNGSGVLYVLPGSALDGIKGAMVTWFPGYKTQSLK